MLLTDSVSSAGRTPDAVFKRSKLKGRSRLVTGATCILRGDISLAFDTDQFRRARRPAQSNCLSSRHPQRKVTFDASDTLSMLASLHRVTRDFAAVAHMGKTDTFTSVSVVRPSAYRVSSISSQSQDGAKMPYLTNAGLPASVRYHLPPHAQDIYRSAFNHAFEAHVADPRREEAAHRIAWAAVKRAYFKDDGIWVKKPR